MALVWKNLDESKAYSELRQTDALLSLKEDLTPERINSWRVGAGGGLEFYYGASLITESDYRKLADLANEQQLVEKYRALADGEIINTGEKRRVLHHLTRGRLGAPVVEDGVDLREFYEEQRKRFSAFSEKVHKGDITGSTGKPFQTVVQIGIGGSDLGPRALYLALKNAGSLRMEARFISNVDPDDVADVLDGLDLESTLFVLVSKSGTTQETLANRDLVTARMESLGIPGLNPSGHFVAVTSKTSPLAATEEVIDAFFIDDYIGGRYSATSAVGGVVLSLALGPEVFLEFLEGAHEADRAALENDPRRNAALTDALIGIFRRNVLGLSTTAILPYSQALSRFPAHLQQLDMESNGKSVNRRGETLNYATGPVVFGEPGTNGQHSFYQLLHQGTEDVPLQFIGFRDCQIGEDVEIDGSTSRTKLNANLVAQIVAFAKGRYDANPNKNFDGQRTSTLLVADKLTPRAMGALLAHFENKVMFQGFCWNVNSFDQEGVQLGKILTKDVLSGKSEDPALQAYAEILGVSASVSGK